MAPAPIKRQSEQGAGSAGRGSWDAVVGGGGLASLSAALYLGRSPWRALLIDAGESMARWEPIVENYLGFPEGLSGQKLPELGRGDAGLFAVRYGRDGRQNVSVDDAWQQALEEQGVPVGGEPVNALLHRDGWLEGSCSKRERAARWKRCLRPEVTSITRRSPRELGAEGDEEGQLIVDGDMRTSVPGLYAAGCVTPANCQMIIAAGQGATAAQAIDHDLFNEYWRSRTLPRIERTGPEILRSGALKWMA